MKKEDMKKRLSGEKTGLKIESNKISFLFIFFFLSSEILPQIPINGFCKLNSYKFTPGYSKIFSLNYNNDSYSDLILYEPTSKKVSAISGKENESFTQEKIFDFPFQISNLAPIRERNNEIKKYAFTSRKNLTAGICEFASNGKPKILQSLLFKSYPYKLSAFDIDRDSQQEILISGPSFEGLSILKLVNKKLAEIKITAKGSYSEALFIDLSNDGMPDIAAINLLTNSLEFFLNDGRGNFKSTRSISLNKKGDNLHSFDMNLDSYQDLVFSEGNKLKIIYGDFASSYSKQIEIETNYSPKDFIIGDFNKDGKIDLAYLSLNESAVSVIFSKDDMKFFPEITLFRMEGIQSIIPFYSKFIDGLAVISNDGTLLTNTKLSSLSSDIDVSLSINPKDISYFDADNNSINDICFIDGFNKSLKLLVRDNDGVPSNYYSIPLHGDHNQLTVNVTSKQSTDFFCYSEGKKLVEVINVEFKTGEITRDEFYSAKPITQIRSVKSDDAKLFVSSLVNDKLSTEIFEKDESWKLLTDYNISEKVISADFSALKGLKLFFWKIDEDSIKLFKKTFLPEEKKAELVLKLKLKEITEFFTISDDFLNFERESLISFVESNQKQYILVSRDKFVNVFAVKELNKYLQINNTEQLFAGEIRPNGTKKLIANNYNDQTLYKLNILKNGNKIAFSKMLDKIDAKKYFVKNMTMNKYHLVYLNQAKGCISIRQI